MTVLTALRFPRRRARMGLSAVRTGLEVMKPVLQIPVHRAAADERAFPKRAVHLLDLLRRYHLRDDWMNLA